MTRFLQLACLLTLFGSSISATDIIFSSSQIKDWCVIPASHTTLTRLEFVTSNPIVPFEDPNPEIAEVQTMKKPITTAPSATTVIKGIRTVSHTPGDFENPQSVVDTNPSLARNIDAANYKSLGAAVMAIGSSVRTLVISTTDFPSGSSVTIPRTLTLQFTGVGTVLLGAGHTVTHLGGAEGWPMRQIFSGPGVIRFGGSTHPRNSRIPEVYPQWWGATGDNVTDNLAAFNAARDSAGTLGSGTIKITQGNFYLSKTLVLTTLVKLIGSSGKGTRGDTGNGISQLVFPAGVTGILVAAPSYSAGQPEGGNSSIQDLEIRARAKSGTAYGVHLNMRAAISNIYVTGFSSHGVYIDSNESDKNCNNWYISNVALYLNGGDGLRVNGYNANAGNAIGVDASQNSGYGIRDTSFLGNIYIGPHSMGNALGGFSSTGGVNRSTWVLPYAESGQPNSSFNFPALLLGGTLGGGGQDMTGTTNYFFNNGEIRAGNPAAVTNFQVSDLPTSGVLWQRTGEARVRVESLSPFGPRDAKLELYIPNGGGDDPAGTVSFRAQTSGVETEFARISANRGTGGSGALVFRVGLIDAAKISGSGLFSSSKGANVASAAVITPTGNVFTITGVVTISTISTAGVTPGTVLHMITKSAGLLFDEAGNLDITNATSLTSTANGLVIAVWDGTKWRTR
ncbi:hypothetical protein BH18ACI4_BH18ACI4_18830 [soil metagenome]